MRSRGSVVYHNVRPALLSSLTDIQFFLSNTDSMYRLWWHWMVSYCFIDIFGFLTSIYKSLWTYEIDRDKENAG
jgi:hypothetical protein